MNGASTSASGLSEANCIIAEKVVDTFNGPPKVSSYHDADRRHTIHVATKANCPSPGVTSYSTMGLSDTPLIQNGEEFDTRLEILAACASTTKFFDRAVSTAAFYIIREKAFCAPGHVFMDILNQYEPDILFPHFYFTTPCFWEHWPRTMQLPGKVVSFLQAIPISESERRYLLQHGEDAFETLLEEKDVDLCDLSREPVV
ncbi:hypothetical protein FQN53_003518 [Emmonsiellopsis sp. PD_33]|nr:hypothetical protein FQN53_003518 [Emmonsiellopsis sp. PD_33]